ncbi:ATP-binding protein [Cupriavidus sp. AU9028]|uniref:hybrid sensor histidine kinase/response regulator n=1 Tax=Cupriavidus sp. AU9028 TaxID=2871157 RepID=UPI001C98D279|nr:ATP-binding protein [Cupriavidus sp. AU9028]MBY4896963.1 PAS domain S-box protein [Cupriavidus sp. AU9028]
MPSTPTPARGAPARPAQTDTGARLESRYQMLVEAIQDYAIFTLDPRGNVTSWNRGVGKIKGYAAHEIIGRHFSCFYTPDAVARGWPEFELEQAAKIGRFEDEGWRVRKDGTLFWANVIITALYDEHRNLEGFAKVTRDMSERKRLQELEESSRRMSQFLATLSHELRNPIAPMRNAVNLMRLEGVAVGSAASTTLSHCQAVLDRQLTHLTRLVDDLLDMGRITSGKVELQLSRVELSDIVARAVESARPSLDRRRQQLDLRLPPMPVVLRADSIRLIQVLQNLLLNSSKFSPPASRIEVSCQLEAQALELRVRDEGRGIAAEDLENVFDLFFQSKAGAKVSEEGGLGIGLSLCRSLVELHGGSIRASSAGEGMGATFTVRLPLGLAPAEEARDTRVPEATRQLRVLVVDDNRDSADSLGMLLQVLGHDVRVAYDAEEAMERSSDFVPDLALLDLAMPMVDGFALLRGLRALPEWQHTVYAAMTGFGQPGDRAESKAAGFAFHIVKPVELPKLQMLLAVVESGQLPEADERG